VGGVAGYFGRSRGGLLKYAYKDMGQVKKSCPGLNGEACILKKYLDGYQTTAKGDLKNGNY
jgi:hypothetical protein